MGTSQSPTVFAGFEGIILKDFKLIWDNPRSSDYGNKKKLIREVKQLKEKLSSKTSRYQGKIDSVPSFNAAKGELSMEQWLHTIDATGKVFDWDDKARIFCMTNKLKDNAKDWYNSQEKLNLSWEEWKIKLLDAFPPQQGVFRKLKELVNTVREKHQNLIDF
ncbi:hypothetical protein QE152_g12618 [Popillia japonica]|uniref:Retrotransposon gag domain-containing protein n=1 Tax=Popillia japonica TaxID=7064 RepID=A0AAW1LR50_POPJA